MVNVVVNVSKIVVAVGVAAGIIILASKADAEGAKVVLSTAARGRCNDHREDLMVPSNSMVRSNCQNDSNEGGNEE